MKYIKVTIFHSLKRKQEEIQTKNKGHIIDGFFIPELQIIVSELVFY